jgi:predicted nucleotidyltransferase component of viral defense system
VDDVVRLPATDRADLFVATGTGRGLASEMIEKDFWVCWTLKRLFTLPDPPAGLLFKGGTSLSKVFGVIERFSEDVDLSFDRADLGFEGHNDVLETSTRKGRKKKLDKLKKTCQQVIREQFLPQLKAAFTDALGESASTTWGLELAEDDPDEQTLLFRYPTGIQSRGESSYIRPTVRMEIGARGEPWPAIDAPVSPYAAQDYPRAFKDPKCTVRVLKAERTFWEKVTILHRWYHRPDKSFADRQSRHYYDVVRLYEHELGRAAVKDVDLLLKVAEHKELFFPEPEARYAEAKPGTLRIVPPDTRLAELEKDYKKMQEMIFGKPPEFEHLLTILRQIEQVINAKSSTKEQE